MPKHTAIYARVSGKTQTTKSQEPDLQAYAAANPDEPVRWYRDTFTGKTMDRPSWKQLEEEIKAHQISAVVVWRLDRLGRTAKGLTSLFEMLREYKVNLISLKDGIDLSTAAGRLMANVLASIAQFETELRGERVAAGQAVARANGKRWGGSKPGVRKKVKRGQMVEIRRMYAQGTPVARIATAFRLSRPTIYDVLKPAKQRRQEPAQC